MSPVSLLLWMVTLLTMTQPGKFWLKVELGKKWAYFCRYFVGGIVLQRPALTSVGDIVVAGFGGHCDNFNYTGMLVSVSKTSGVGVTNIYAMEASPGEGEITI
jgi:hypothetical protein